MLLVIDTECIDSSKSYYDTTTLMHDGPHQSMQMCISSTKENKAMY